MTVSQLITTPQKKKKKKQNLVILPSVLVNNLHLSYLFRYLLLGCIPSTEYCVQMFIDLLIFVCKDVTEIEQEQAQAAMEESILK